MRNLADTGIIWVFCENGPQGVREVSYELLGAAARLAKDAGTRVIAVALGAGVPVEEMCARGADEVLLVEDAALDAPEEMRYTEEICALAREFSPDIFLLGGTMFGRSLAPRVAARLSTGLTADCTQLEIDKETGLLLQTRPAFGGNLFATILCPEARPQMATVRPKVFPMPEADRTRPVRVKCRKAVSKPSMVELLSLRGGEAGVNLADYDVLVCVGQGIAARRTSPARKRCGKARRHAGGLAADGGRGHPPLRAAGGADGQVRGAEAVSGAGRVRGHPAFGRGQRRGAGRRQHRPRSAHLRACRLRHRAGLRRVPGRGAGGAGKIG